MPVQLNADVKDIDPTYPFSGWDPQAILLCVKATLCADISNKVNILFILGLLALSALILSIEVEEAAGKHKVTARVR